MKLQENAMAKDLYPSPDPQLSKKRRELAPDAAAAFAEFSKQVFADGALPAKTKQIIAVAVAHVTQCPYCIRGHTRGALRTGASEAEIMEAIWVAAEMRAGGAYAHSAIALDEMNEAAAAAASAG
jgi:AhpD family alkylhydroperoxidase